MVEGDFSPHALTVQSALLREHPELRPCSSPGVFEMLAVYPGTDDELVFTFCLNGILLHSGDEPRYVPYLDIQDSGYFGTEALKQEKSGVVIDCLTLVLVSGERIELPLRQRDDRFSERLAIGRIIKNRIARARP